MTLKDLFENNVIDNDTVLLIKLMRQKKHYTGHYNWPTINQWNNETIINIQHINKETLKIEIDI